MITLNTWQIAVRMPQKRKRVTARRRAKVVDRLIKLKVKCNFSVAQLKEIISMYQPNDAECIEKCVHKELRQNYSAFRLHGCSQCDDFVWLAGEKMDCDICHNQDGRFVPLIFIYRL